MINETFEEYWHRLKETELKKDPARVDTKYQCKGAWNARGEVEQKKIDELEKNLQAERDKVALASSIFATLADLNTVLIKRT